MKVKIKRLHPDAVIPFKKYPSDFCHDVVAVSEEQIAPNVWKYGLGIALQMERGWEPFLKEYLRGCYNPDKGDYDKVEANSSIDLRKSPLSLSIDFRPRSSVWRTGMVLSNCEGTIDESYTGEIFAVFYHVLPDMPRYRVGQKIGQIKIGITLPIQFEEVNTLSYTDRGTGSYGSTGR